MMGVLFGVAFGLHDEREWGVITRLLIAPVSRMSVLGGKLLARFIVGLFQLVLLFLYGHFVFGLSLGNAPVALGLVMAAVVFSMTGFSLLISAFARTREQVIPLGLTVIMVFCALGGCRWPLYQMPPWLRRVAQLTFTAWAMEGFTTSSCGTAASSTSAGGRRARRLRRRGAWRRALPPSRSRLGRGRARLEGSQSCAGAPLHDNSTRSSVTRGEGSRNTRRTADGVPEGRGAEERRLGGRRGPAPRGVLVGRRGTLADASDARDLRRRGGLPRAVEHWPAFDEQ
jgi:hypothetical protein